jgi:uncharacterized protein (DUF934 family)
MIIEYRSSSGTAAFKATLGEQVSLRSLGCPDWLAKKVEESRASRNHAVSAPVQQSTEVEALREKFNSVSLF